MEKLSHSVESSTRIRLLIADDHPMIRSGLAALVARESNFDLVGEAVTGAEAVAKVQELEPDVILMDLKMPEMGGLEAIRVVRSLCPSVNIVIFTTFEGEEDIYRGLQAGAKAYLLKDSPCQEVVRCINVVASGRKFVPGDVAAKLAERMEFNELSARELEVLQYLTSGKSNKAIARMAGIGEGTVKFHVNNILSKLGVSSRTEAVTLGAKRGLIDLH
ncbi:MAG: response regulator transcription factor [Burkholderiaceae bacterium]|jgi:two-component system NarL family response regulator